MAEKLSQPDQANGNSTAEQEMVSFSVMPHSGNFGRPVSSPNAPVSQPKPQPEAQPQAQSMFDSGNPPEEAEHHGIWHSKVTYIVIGLLVLSILGVLAYFLLWSDTSTDDDNQAVSKLPKIFLKEHFGVDICLDTAKCGDDADHDKDGLSNYDEFVQRTLPTKNDTDEDGLADGDELNIYHTEPINKYTDNRPASVENGYSDGSQIKNDYDPLTPGIKMTEVRKKQIADAITQFGLHEPTKTTLQAGATPQATSVTVFIINGKFDPPAITINANDTVIWLNKDSKPHQIMSNVHPAHDILPDLGSGILGTNQTYSYKFTKAGTYAYHDEENPAVGGSVEVK